MKYSINTSNTIDRSKNKLKMKGSDLYSNVISVNNRHLLFNGKPWIPVMGEFHFSRYDHREWEFELLKMKAAGIKIISTYLFWIHHEEEEGRFNFIGDRNIRRFIELCQKHDLYCFIRIGPWAHGECRNGGFPDWLIQKPITCRSTGSSFLQYTKRIYIEYFNQIKGLLFKDGGPIIGIQIENEKVDDGCYLLELKKMALAVGFDIPLYTITGWAPDGIAEFPEYEFIPVFGGYPEAPWEQKINALEPNANYFFLSQRNDSTIGSDQIRGIKGSKGEESLQEYPYCTCEIGPGVQNCYHRRPIISTMDVYAMAITKLGSGNNLPGYYVFHGGRNPIGGLYQESRDSDYPNDLPVSSYDFQAPIGEYGFLKESYHYYRILHLFIESFGEVLAPMEAVFPNETPRDRYDIKTMRMAVRQQNNSGFLFVNNYQRTYSLAAHEEVQIEIRVEDEVIQMPNRPFKVEAGQAFIWPFNLELQDVCIQYMTAQPITKVIRGNEEILFVLECGSIPIALKLLKDTVKSINGKHKIENGEYLLEGILEITSTTNKILKIVPLKLEDALNIYKGKLDGRDNVIVSSTPVVFNKGKLELYGAIDVEEKVYSILPIASSYLIPNADEGVYYCYSIKCPKKISIVDKVRIIPIEEENVTQGAVRYIPYMFIEDILQIKNYRLIVEKDLLRKVEDVRVDLKIEGDVIQFYSGEELLADYFNDRGSLSIGLRRFKEVIEEKGEIELRLSGMRSGKSIYLEQILEKDKAMVEIINAMSYYKIK